MKQFGKLMLLVLALGLLAVVLSPIPAHLTTAQATTPPAPPPSANTTVAETCLAQVGNGGALCFPPAIPVPNGLAMQIDYVSLTVSLSPVGSNLLGASLGYQPTACVNQTMPGLGVVGPCQVSVNVQPPCSLIGTNPSPTPPILPFSNYVCSGPVTLYASQGNQSPYVSVSSTATSGEVFATISGHYIKNPGD
jgi:hypothetical protein